MYTLSTGANWFVCVQYLITPYFTYLRNIKLGLIIQRKIKYLLLKCHTLTCLIPNPEMFPLWLIVQQKREKDIKKLLMEPLHYCNIVSVALICFCMIKMSVIMLFLFRRLTTHISLSRWKYQFNEVYQYGTKRKFASLMLILDCVCLISYGTSRIRQTTKALSLLSEGCVLR